MPRMSGFELLAAVRQRFPHIASIAITGELEVIPHERPQVDVTRQGVFFAGQTFDALSLASRIFATAKVRLLLIDGYIGADTLNILPTTGIQIDILTKPPLSAQVETLCQAFKTQHGSLTVKTPPAFHDRFVVIDNAAVYHFGASIKDLGKKDLYVFADRGAGHPRNAPCQAGHRMGKCLGRSMKAHFGCYASL